jgi:hypothetical protein
MIPSSSRRTWVFLILSSISLWGPDLMVPSAWEHAPVYLLVSNLYQSFLVVAGFWFGPAICRAMVVSEVKTGPAHDAIRHALDELGRARSTRRLPVTLFEHQHPFILTAGMLPGQCEIFVSTELARHLGPDGLRFQIARAMAHSALSQRLAALIPVLLLTVLFPSSFDWATSAYLVAFLLAWLAFHWFFELQVDRWAARALGERATTGLIEMLTATDGLAQKISLHPPLRWRMKAVSSVT